MFLSKTSMLTISSATLKPAMLYTEVRVFEAQKDKLEQSEKANEDNIAFVLHKVQKGKRRDGGQDVSYGMERLR